MNKCIVVILACILVSCEKNINFDLKQSPEVLVVDASIENDQAPVVVLTKSFAYFGKLEPQLLAGSFVHDAEVYSRQWQHDTPAKRICSTVSTRVHGLLLQHRLCFFIHCIYR